MTSSSCRSWKWKIGSLSICFLDNSFKHSTLELDMYIFQMIPKRIPFHIISPNLRVSVVLGWSQANRESWFVNPQIHELLPSITIWVGGSTHPGLPGVFWGQAAVWVQQHSEGHRYQGQATDRATRNWRRRPTGAWEAIRATVGGLNSLTPNRNPLPENRPAPKSKLYSIPTYSNHPFPGAMC